MKKYIFSGIFILIIAVCNLLAEINDKLNSFEDCAKAGNIVLKTYPAKCVTKEGQIFWQKRDEIILPSSPSFCVSACGNGMCEEVTCLAEGCPCSENATSCPKDCS